MAYNKDPKLMTKGKHPEICQKVGHDWVAHPVKRIYVCATCGAQRTV